jgi:hypothetical protein
MEVKANGISPFIMGIGIPHEVANSESFRDAGCVKEEVIRTLLKNIKKKYFKIMAVFSQKK